MQDSKNGPMCTEQHAMLMCHQCLTTCERRREPLTYDTNESFSTKLGNARGCVPRRPSCLMISFRRPIAQTTRAHQISPLRQCFIDMYYLWFMFVCYLSGVSFTHSPFSIFSECTHMQRSVEAKPKCVCVFFQSVELHAPPALIRKSQLCA